jgi:GTP cyclohydrolase I
LRTPLLPIVGKAHVAYFSSGQVIGLSKITGLSIICPPPAGAGTADRADCSELKKVLKTDDVAVVIDARHMCVSCRGIKDESSSTVTAEYHGKFKDNRFVKNF